MIKNLMGVAYDNIHSIDQEIAAANAVEEILSNNHEA
jgi:hypothetical protein